MTDPLLRDISELRPPHLADALAEITSQLTGGPDSATVLRLVTDAGTGMLGAAATGVMMVDPRGGVGVVAASDQPARFVELLQTQTQQGPCLDCIATGRASDGGRSRQRQHRTPPAHRPRLPNPATD